MRKTERESCILAHHSMMQLGRNNQPFWSLSSKQRAEYSVTINKSRRSGGRKDFTWSTYCLTGRRRPCSWEEAGTATPLWARGALPGEYEAPSSKLALLPPQSPARHVPLWQDQRLTPGRATHAEQEPRNISIQTFCQIFAYIWVSITMPISKNIRTQVRAEQNQGRQMRFSEYTCKKTTTNNTGDLW